MDRSEFKKRMQSLKSYREQNPGKGYWDWRVKAFQDGGKNQNTNISSLNNSEDGGYTTPWDSRFQVFQKRDPTMRFSPEALLFSNMLSNEGEENSYWYTYLGLGNKVPKMQDSSLTKRDLIEEKQKVEKGQPTADFFGTTPRMDLSIQALADTLMLGKISRDYDKYSKQYKNLPSAKTINNAYKRAKNILNSPDKWVLVNGDEHIIRENPEGEYERNPLGMLRRFHMLWDPEEGELRMQDIYDFPWYARLFGTIPQRPREMKIRGSINFDPNKGSIILRDSAGYNSNYPEVYQNNSIEEYKNGGIHIKPENRGKFTRLKERTGKSATWFKQHGTPEQKKMATFALNAKKWKHADGGEIPPELYERSDYQGSNEPVYVNPFTGKPLATGAITPAFTLEDFANFTPAGDALSVRDAFIAAKNKDLIGLGLAGLGVLPFIPTVNRNHFAERFAEMERRDAKKHEMLDDFFKQRNEVYEDLIENEEAYRRAAKADRLSNSNYRDTYSEMIKQYGKGNTNPNLIQPATDRALYATSTKAQVDPKNLDYIFLNPRYADPDELETAFQRMNPGLIRHEIGHIVDTKAGLDYTNRLSDPNRFVSDEQLKLMFPKSHKRLRNEILNRGSEIKSYMNEFRNFLMNKHEYNDRETVNGIRRKLDRYSKQFPVLNRIYDSYKSKKQFVKDYNSVPLTATESNKITV